jgi:Pentapeptide repeats (8 copies)
MTIKINYYLLFWCATTCLVTAPAVYAYNPADLKVLATTNKCAGCDLSGANLSGKQLVNTDLQSANLVGANLTGANFTGAKLDGANLSGAVLTNTNFTGAVLQGASMIDINFTNTNLSRTDLSYANLVNSSFKGAIVSNTNLTGANLVLADLTGINFSNISLTNANLAGAKGVNRSTPRTNQPGDVQGERNSVQQNNPRSTPITSPRVEESSPVFRRPRVYRIPPGLGSPDRRQTGGTRESTPIESGSF